RLHQELFVDQAIEHLALDHRIVELAAIEARTLVPARLGAQLLDALAELLRGYLLLADARHERLGLRLEIVVDAEERERDTDRGQDQECDPARRLLSKCLQHVLSIRTFWPAVAGKNKGAV